ncbi:MAG TPA: hypothetical protein DF613_09715 [Lachnospiraceae bacterium]|nr:hypothetical protein [Lachnospiraceae bacterium]
METGKKRRAAVLFICAGMLAAGPVYAEGQDVIQDAKQGTVEVCSGITTDDGVFHEIHHGSGFVIAGGDDRAYVATVCRAATSSTEEKLAFCEANGIPTENASFQETVRVVVKGDVTANAVPLIQSEEQDYAILEVDGGISERTSLALGTAEAAVTGDTVYALGFADDAGAEGNGTEFSAADVQIRQGTIQDTRAGQNGSFYIQHSAAVSGGNTGGPLLNQDGYVVGINSMAADQDGNDGVYYSLPIDEVRVALDNFQIDYGSVEKDRSLESFRSLLAESRALLDSKEYKTASKAALEQAVQDAERLLEDDAGADELAAAGDSLEEAKNQLQPKMALSKKIIIGLGAVAAILLIWLIRLILWKAGAKKNGAGQVSRKNEAAESRRTETQKPASKQRKDTEDGKHRTAADVRDRQPDKRRIVLDEEDGTVILGQDNIPNQMFLSRKKTAILSRFGTSQIFPVNSPEFTIGKKADVNDLVLTDNPAVSRRHARIFWEDQEYYIVDLGSANGTFVNSARLDPDVRRRLKNGDTITLADERFGFTLEDQGDRAE